MGLTNVAAAVVQASEIAPCPICQSRLEFDSEKEYGRTIERCTNPSCPNRRWHAPTFNKKDLIPEKPKRKRLPKGK
jgi:hypothetical protein